MKKAKIYLYMLATLVAFVSCSNEEALPEETILNYPTEIQISIQDEKANISGKSDMDSEVTLQYNHNLGAVLRQVDTDAQGNFSFTIDLLVGYEQEFIVFATKDHMVSEKIVLDNIPVKTAFQQGWDTAKTLLLAHKWKSNQTRSRIIIKQTSSTPPYDTFATVAQKYFEFKANGAFYFTVTSPLQYTDTSGDWTMDSNGIMLINTTIPLGPMQISNAKIQQLDNQNLEFLVNISDGLFLLSFDKE